MLSLIKKYSSISIYIYFGIIFLCKGFNLRGDDLLYMIAYIIGILFVISKVIFDKYEKQEIIRIFSLIGTALIIYLYTKNRTPLFFAISICCLKNIKIKNIMQVMFYSTVISTGIMMILSIAGIIPNDVLLITRGDVLLKRYCFGYIHPNIVHMQYLTIVCLYYFLYDHKANVKTTLLFFLINLLLFRYTGSRTSCYLIIVVLIYFQFFHKRKIFEKTLMYISKYSYFIFFAVTILLAMLYNKIEIVQKLDIILTGRIYYCKLLLENYVVPLFGRAEYAGILFDNSYFYLLYKSGIIFTILYSYMMYKLGKYFFDNKMKKEMFFLLMINAFCISENIFLSININFINITLAEIIFLTKAKTKKNIKRGNYTKNKITVFTPTYNRCDLIKRLYQSLLCQTNKDFIWLVIDDGSTDDTKKYINSLKPEFPIEYIYQKNGGKYKAYNKAIELCNTEYFVCVDSDDYFKNELGIENIFQKIKKIDSKNIGIVFPWRKKLDKNIPEEFDIQDIKNKYNKTFESTILIKTDVLKQHQFPENDEKFMSEEILYNELAEEGKFAFENVVLVSGEYQADGLTNNIFKTWCNSYNNTILLFKSRYTFMERYNFILRWKNRIKCVINCNAVNIITKNDIKNSPNIILSYLLYIPSVIYLKIKRRK